MEKDGINGFTKARSCNAGFLEIRCMIASSGERRNIGFNVLSYWILDPRMMRSGRLRKPHLSEKLSYDIAWRAAQRKNGAVLARFQERDGDAARWKAPFAIATLGPINRKHAECRKSKRTSRRVKPFLRCSRPSKRASDATACESSSLPVIDYREIIKRSRPRRAKKSHLTARGQRDTAGTTMRPMKTCKAASPSGRDTSWRNK